MRRLLLVLASLAALAAAPGASAATWCGTDQTSADRPDVIGGPQVHLVYAIPSDGLNSFAAAASAMATDAETIDAWWRSQDPVRTPRFDLAPFPGCSGFNALDISFVQLPLSSAQLFPNSGRFSAIRNSLSSLGPWKKLLVWYDGPLEDPGTCGVAGGSQTTATGSLAVIYPRSSCARTQSLRAAVMVHELIHSLGFPNGRQPHPCTFDTGHVCDSNRDLMYPFLSAPSLDELVLDVNRDDYYRVGGTGDLSTSIWLRRLELPPQPLALTITGAGRVTSDVPGLRCDADCVTQWDGDTRVVLAASPAPGMRFVGWKGSCVGLDCVLTLSSAANVEAVFAPLLRLRASVSGRGRVVTRGIACPSVCSTQLDAGYTLTVTAKPQPGWRFAGWTGACRSTTSVCRLTVRTDVSVRARFVKR